MSAPGAHSSKYGMFNVIHEAHVSIGHRDRMVKETITKYKNITEECIMITHCMSQRVPKKGLVVYIDSQ